jgi:hypothetical protein
MGDGRAAASLTRVARAGATLIVAWLAGCASTSTPLPPGARGVYAFDVATYLGRRYSGYGTTEQACRERRATELALEKSQAPERFPFFRTTVLTRCYPAALQAGGYAWAVEADDTWGAIMPSAALCDAMRDTLVGARRVTVCAPVTLTPR